MYMFSFYISHIFVPKFVILKYSTFDRWKWLEAKSSRGDNTVAIQWA